MFQPRFTASELATIADAIHTFDGTTFPRGGQLRAIAEHFADRLAPTNPLFDRERFIRAATTGINRKAVR